jgi:hypothetical protein
MAVREVAAQIEPAQHVAIAPHKHKLAGSREPVVEDRHVERVKRTEIHARP